MDINSLNPAQLAALAKADASGVTIVHNGKPVDTGTADVTPPVAAVVPPVVVTPPAVVPPVAAVKPEGVPDKFWNATTGAVNYAAWGNSTRELEKQFTQSRQAVTPPAAAVTPPADVVTPPVVDGAPVVPPTLADQVPPVVTPPVVDPAAAVAAARASATADLAKDGKISDTSYAALAASGFDRATVDTYVAGEQAKTSLYINSLYTAGGGEAQYKSMLKWAGTTYSPEEVQAFDAAVRSTNPGSMKLAVAGLTARYSASFGTGGKPVTPTPNDQSNTGVGFKSQAEMTAAMKDPRWAAGDATYRAEVTQKIAAADAAGTDIGLRVMRGRNG